MTKTKLAPPRGCNANMNTNSEEGGVATDESVPIKEKVAYGFGFWARQMGTSGVKDLITPIYNVQLGVNPATTGVILACMRLWDAITDPLVGRLSDNTLTRWGRRKPFIVLGGLLMGLFYPLIWLAAPGWTESSKLIYLFCSCTIFYCIYSLFQVPYAALEFELTPSYSERTRVRTFVSLSAKAFFLVFPWLFPLSQSDIFPDSLVGIRVITAIAGAVIVLSAAVAGTVPKERYLKVAKAQKAVPFFPALKHFVRDKNFWMLKGLGLGIMFSHMLVEFMRVYVEWYYIWQGDVQKGSTFTALGSNISTVMGIALIVMIYRYFSNYDKRKIIACCVIASLVGQVIKWFIINPNYPYLSLLIPALQAPAMTVFWALYGSMQGDFCDYDEYNHGKRREGAYSSTSSWIEKSITSLALGASGFIVAWCGFDVASKEVQAAETFFGLRLALCVIPSICYLIVLFLVLKYPLSKVRMLQIRQSLEERRGKAADT